VILAVVLTGISPACAFISGKSSIEICAPDGTLRVIDVDSAFDPFAEPMPLSEHLEAMEQCPYCFSADHAKSYDLQSGVQYFKALPRYIIVSSGTLVPEGLNELAYRSRAPPYFS